MNDFKKLKSNYWIIKKRTECTLQVWDNSGGILPIGGKGSCLVKDKFVKKDPDFKQN